MLESWKLPLPDTGINLRLATGQRWSFGIVMTDPSALMTALIAAGATAALAAEQARFTTIYARTRASVSAWRIDHFAMKFIVFPLVPALPAFRLHQHIAFGGSFGEYYTYGLKAYLIAFLIWWASWAIGMVLFAALLRVVIEMGTLLSIAVREESAVDARRWLELLGRLLYFVGVPALLLLRVWP